LNVTAAWVAAEAARMRGQHEARLLADELGCEVTPHPERPGVVEAREPSPGVYVLVGTPAEVRAAGREAQLREWLAVLGTLRGSA
jgi:hypothetical protein